MQKTKFYFLFLVFIFLQNVQFSYGQDYDFYALDFPKPKKLKRVIFLYDCFTCTPQELGDTTDIFLFNTDGQVIQAVNYYKGVIEGYSDFKYNPNSNQLESIRDYGGYLYSYNEKTKDWDIATWDNSTSSLKKFVFKEGRLQQTEYFSGRSNDPEYRITFDYSSNGQLLSEVKTKFSNSKSNISEKHDETHEKVCLEKGDTLICKCFKNGRLVGYELSTWNALNKITYFVEMNLTGRVLSFSIYTYDKSGKILMFEMRDSGRDVFGTTYDNLGYLQRRYTYNDSGFLISSKDYFKGRVISSTRIIYDL